MNTRLRAREGEYDMIHMIQNAKDQAARLTLAAYAAAAAAGDDGGKESSREVKGGE